MIIKQKEIVKLSKEGLPLAFNMGCYDILHVNHVRFINKIRCISNAALAIGILDDSLVRYLKGMERPVNSQDDRVELISNIKVVDYAFIVEDIGAFEYYKQKYVLVNENQELWKKYIHCVNTLRPREFYYSSSFAITQKMQEALNDYTTIHRPLPYIGGISTSRLISKIKELQQ
ncbi:MAG: hypothetical protein LBQ98_07095 [Nitrososphaerota archaeon]|nr:hypothetical protein [Nitrososphaerota archaeon]